ncbi:hypothetical protein [Oceanimonas sp. MB9]|uniref:hypothetical protein n=1 Tax=Oceanimonas sp. MB9 TaxID=2588453 RepID=UPI0013F60E43|nr:hypothetical protein [Oceanimonas sp. MB9]NHI00681.1 hypothetical protein [Oceanimonas sp. MB9]
MDFAFNELSESNIRSPDDLDAFYNQLVKLMRIANLKEFPSVVFTDDFSSKDFNGLGNAYKLMSSSKLERDEYEHFLSIIVNAPFSSSIEIIDDQYLYDSSEVKGFQYSCINSIRSVSIPGSNWDKYNYLVDKLSLDDTSDELITSQINIEHLGSLSNTAGTWLQKYLPRSEFSNAQEFLEIFPSKYPNVLISDEARNSLRGFNMGKLNQLDRAMGIFQIYCDNYWKNSFRRHVITKLGVHIKDESEQTMNRYGDQRLFLNENGEKEIIPLHFNISEDFRGYIKPAEENKIFLAYLGPHLSTVKYK